MSNISQLKAKLEALDAEAKELQFAVIGGDTDRFLIQSGRTGTYFSFGTNVPNDKILRTIKEEPIHETPVTKVVLVD